MTQNEWMQLDELWEEARNGNDEAFGTVCEVVDSKVKPIVMSILKAGRVSRKEFFDEAWQEAMLIFVRKGGQPVEDLRKIFPKPARALPKWLATTVFRCAIKNGCPWYPRTKKGKASVQQTPEPPQPTGTKTVMIDGRQHEVKIYRMCSSPTTPLQFRPRVDQLTEYAIEKWVKTAPPDYVRQIDDQRTLAALQKAVAELPPRWHHVIRLVYFEGKSRTEAAKILGCRRQRIYKILKMTKRRLRELLASCSRGCSANRTVSLVQAERPLGRCETWVMELRHDDIHRGIPPFEQELLDGGVSASWFGSRECVAGEELAGY